MRRSREMWLVGYFLSRFGVRMSDGTPSPPSRLQVREWNRAYAMFYRRLGDGRTLASFANSLKNARDTFDGHLNSGRVGWRRGAEDREPAALPKTAAQMNGAWEHRSEQDLWEAVSPYLDAAVAAVPNEVLSDLFAEIDPESREIRVRTEGGIRAVVTNRIERDPSLRHAALCVHGYRCQVCGFSFEETYGPWGKGFAIVHHLRMLADGGGEKRETDPKTDLAVLCANCHCMVHRRRNVVLTLAELRDKLVKQPASSLDVKFWSKKT